MFKWLFMIGLPLLLIFSIITATPEDNPSSLIESHLWQEPVLLVFSKEKAQPERLQQFSYTLPEKLVVYDIVDASHVAKQGQVLPHIPASRFFEYYQIKDASFALVLVGKDGEIMHRGNTPLSSDNIVALLP